MTINGRIITADENKILTNGDISSRQIVLGQYDSVENWSERDMTESEKDEAKAELVKLGNEKIAELKEKLAQSDYKAIKYAEGWIDEEDYAPIKAERQEIREKINMLEKAAE